MRKIHARQITSAISELCIEANTNLRSDVKRALRLSLAREDNPRARGILQMLLDNAACACKFKLAICQDTGMPCVFVKLGQEVLIVGGDFLKAINKGVEEGYKRGSLRNSIIAHPFKRKTTPKFSPAVVNVEIVKGARFELTVLPKGFGCENKSALRMFKPSEGIERIKDFIIREVKLAGSEACPPFIVGVGIGATSDRAASLAKEALLRPLKRNNSHKLVAKLEKELLKEINQLGIGPMGLGGKTTCLGVNVLTAPTHIAGLPVAINISCHALRSASRRI